MLIVVVADTAHNRGVLRAHREALRGLLPLDGRQVFAALAAGSLPNANAIVVL